MFNIWGKVLDNFHHPVHNFSTDDDSKCCNFTFTRTFQLLQTVLATHFQYLPEFFVHHTIEHPQFQAD